MIARFLGIILIFSQTAIAEETSSVSKPESPVHGFIDLNIYPYDTRDFSELTVNVQATLPYNLSYFSLVNFSSTFDTGTNEELERFYTEQNIYWKLPSNLPFALTSQWAIASGAANDKLRFGASLFISDFIFLEKVFNAVGLFYVLHVYPLQFDAFDGYNWQMEHFFTLNVLPRLLDERVYITGFADQNMGPEGFDWVTETQLGVRLIQQLYAVTEYRHNDFVTDQDGVAFGAEYKIVF